MLAWDITRWRRIFKINDGDAERKTKSRNLISNFVDSRNVRECTGLFRDSYTAKWPYIVLSECDDYAFCKVCDDSFAIAHGGGNDVIVSHGRVSWTHRGIEQTVKTNSSVRQFCAAPSKTADSKVVSVTRAEVMLCELIVEQNILLALFSC